jgi:hypothetical protein
MPIPWMTVLKSVPWVEVIRNAPKVADAARKLWTTVRSDQAAARVGATTAASAGTVVAGGSVSENVVLRARLDATEAELRELHEQVLASSELIKELAEQNAGLVARAELNRRRTLWLAVATVVSLVVAGAALWAAIAT